MLMKQRADSPKAVIFFARIIYYPEDSILLDYRLI